MKNCQQVIIVISFLFKSSQPTGIPQELYTYNKTCDQEIIVELIKIT